MPPVTANDIELMVRIALAFAMGGLLGFEREQIGRPAGLRTHMLVCVGSACFTVASANAFGSDAVNRDPTRIAAQIVTGIGFLGAGTIFRTTSTVRGLTTAANIWLAAAIGLLVGGGMYWIAIFTTLLALVTLRLLRLSAIRGVREPSATGEPSITGSAGEIID
ncbi:MAG TPA: MgtC/SapB family protein [Chloroflexota bacterium]|jgi:putative Mg2+ transporter-C (MgtC) family protein|nr:MgtC/SapB family protein [Chloroflexota bacterium]